MIGRPVACPVFVGRRGELAALVELRRGLAQSRGACALVGGEAGIGKSRLLSEFARTVAIGRSRTFARTECLERRQEPLGPVRALVAALLDGMNVAALPREAHQALATLLPDRFGAPRDAVDAPALSKSDLFGGIVALLIAVAAKRATILAIEDLHWCDATTLDFLTYAVPKLAVCRILIVATYRSDEVEANPELFAAIGAMQRMPSVFEIALRPLSHDEISELMTAALGEDRALGRDAFGAVAERSSGNPFYAEELLKSAIAGDERERAALPISIRASILERLRLLADGDRRVVAIAAAFGYRFEAAMLASLVDRSPDDVVRALHRARNLNVIELDGDGRRFRFRHALTRQTIYDESLAVDVRSLHARILALLEASPGDERDFDELAHHAIRAGDLVKTLLYNERAAERAISLRAFGEAVACLERALAAARDDADGARLRERLANAADFGGRLERATQEYQRAFDQRMRRHEYDDAARVLVKLVGSQVNAGDLPSMTSFDAFLDRSEGALSVGARDGVLVFAARIAAAADDLGEARRMLARTSEPHALPPRVRVNYYLTELNLRFAASDSTGWRAAAAALEALMSEVDPDFGASALCTVAQTGIFLGENGRVARSLERARGLIADGGSEGVETFHHAVRGLDDFLRGRLADAARALAFVHARPGVMVAQVFASQYAPLVALAIGDPGLAQSPAQARVEREVRAGAVVVDHAVVLAVRAVWLGARGRDAEARHDIAIAMTSAYQPQPQIDLVLVAAAAFGEPGQLDHVCALAEARDGEFPLRHAHLALTRAYAALRSGDLERVEQEALRAGEGYRIAGWPLFEAHALSLAGRDAESAALMTACGVPPREPIASTRHPVFVSPSPSSPLSSREDEVARLVADGLTNAAIGVRLHVSEKTVEKYLSSIFAKLGVRSRTQVATHVATRS